MPYDLKSVKRFKFPAIYGHDPHLVYKNSSLQVFKSGEKCLVIKPTININKVTPEFELARRKEAISKSMSLFKDYVLETEHILIAGEWENGTATCICKTMPWFNEVRELRMLSVKEILHSKKLLGMLSYVNSRCLFFFLKTGKLYDLFNSEYNTIENSKCDPIQRLVNPNIMIGKHPRDGSEKVFVDSDWYIKFSDYKLTNFPVLSYCKVIPIGLVYILKGYILFSLLLLNLKIMQKFNLST